MKNVTLIELGEWDELVSSAYKRPYCLQQQDGCMDRGVVRLTVPGVANDYERDGTSNDGELGVSFKAWLERDPELPLQGRKFSDGVFLSMWWHREFYPELTTLANDLHNRGLLDAGEYIIEIDW